jgi:hypothetical protein
LQPESCRGPRSQPCFHSPHQCAPPNRRVPWSTGHDVTLRATVTLLDLHRDFPDRETAIDRLRAASLAAFENIDPLPRLRCAVRTAEVLGALHQVVSDHSIVNAIEPPCVVTSRMDSASSGMRCCALCVCLMKPQEPVLWLEDIQGVA